MPPIKNNPPPADKTKRSLKDVQTPALVVEQAKLIRNVERMAVQANNLGVRLRPHMKTCKSIDIANLLEDDVHGGITVSTLREAEYFVEHGINDILYAVSIVPQKLDRVAALITDRGTNVCIILDLAETAEQVISQAQRLGVRFDVQIEIDTDGHRAGIEPEDPELAHIARLLDESPYTRFRGLMTHAGESYECSTIAAIEKHAEQERSRCVLAAGHVRKAGIRCDVVSVGSTPTALCAKKLDGVTELRAGVYMFFDLFQAGLGICQVSDIALTVLTTVISHKYSHRRLIIDAGGLALSKDHGTASQAEDQGFGLVARADNGEIIAGLKVAAANQEHGIIQLTREESFSEFPVGSQLRIVPNHACMTAAAHDRYYLVDGSNRLVDLWGRCNGW